MTAEERAELVAGQARLEGKIETLTARLEAHLGRTSDEIKALFADRRDHAEKIEGLLVDYTPKGDFDRHKRQNREDHEALSTSLKEAQWKIAKLVGMITVVAFVVGLLFKTIGGGQ